MTEPMQPSAEMREERLRKRYQAERRFKLYGQIAIAIAVSFLGILLVSIGTKAASAFSRHMLIIEINAPDFAERTDVSVTDVNLAVRDALQDLFPATMTDRAARTELFALTTRLSVLPITRRIQAEPDIARAPITARLALSDDLDLYLKNEVRKHRR